MRFVITNTEAVYRVSVLDDNGDILINDCSYKYPNFFGRHDGLYVALSPAFGLSDDWEVYKLTKVA